MITELTTNNFKLQCIDFRTTPGLDKNAPSVLLIKANWCGHCKTYFPVFEKTSESYPMINFFFVEHENSKVLLDQWEELVHPVFKVKGFPTVVLYGSDGHPMKVVSRDSLEDELSKMI